MKVVAEVLVATGVFWPLSLAVPRVLARVAASGPVLLEGVGVGRRGPKGRCEPAWAIHPPRANQCPMRRDRPLRLGAVAGVGGAVLVVLCWSVLVGGCWCCLAP